MVWVLWEAGKVISQGWPRGLWGERNLPYLGNGVYFTGIWFGFCF